jgi:hypothetical protein
VGFVARDGVVSLWTVYRSPVDYPGVFVARRFVIMPRRAGGRPEAIATSEMFVADSLEEVRALLPAGMFCLPRLGPDQPQIVETWV